jgi:hypothetical protein
MDAALPPGSAAGEPLKAAPYSGYGVNMIAGKRRRLFGGSRGN